jgi:hypothetical protein
MIWQAVDGFLSKRPMILFQNHGWLYVQKSRWLFAKTADGCLLKLLTALAADYSRIWRRNKGQITEKVGLIASLWYKARRLGERVETN